MMDQLLNFVYYSNEFYNKIKIAFDKAIFFPTVALSYLHSLNLCLFQCNILIRIGFVSLS